MHHLHGFYVCMTLVKAMVMPAAKAILPVNPGAKIAWQNAIGNAQDAFCANQSPTAKFAFCEELLANDSK